MNLSEKIYSLRKQNNLSQEQLAEQLGVSRQAVSKWEAGQAVPDVDKIINISELFGVTTDYLLKGKDEGSDKTTLSISKESHDNRPSLQKTTGIVLLGISLLGIAAAFFAQESMPFILAFSVLLMIIALEFLLIRKISWAIVLWSVWGYMILFLMLLKDTGILSLLMTGLIIYTGLILLITTIITTIIKKNKKLS